MKAVPIHVDRLDALIPSKSSRTTGPLFSREKDPKVLHSQERSAS